MIHLLRWNDHSIGSTEYTSKMRNTGMSTGYVKVMLLLLGTFSFAAIWSNDQRPVSPERIDVADVAVETEPSSQNEQESLALEWELPTLDFPEAEFGNAIEPLEWMNFPAVPQSTALELTEPSQTDSTWVPLKELEIVRIESIESPLPRAIAPGEYRVIDRFGNVSTQMISLDIAIETGFAVGSDERDSYTARENEDRWHFIRIERDLIAERESKLQADVREAWKSVFEVIGAQTERPLRDLRRPITNWLSPQEIADDLSTVRR